MHKKWENKMIKKEKTQNKWLASLPEKKEAIFYPRKLVKHDKQTTWKLKKTTKQSNK